MKKLLTKDISTSAAIWWLMGAHFVLILCAALLSCRSVKKTEQSITKSSDSTVVSKASSGNVQKQDSTSKSMAQQVVKTEVYNSDQATFSAAFSDTSGAKGPVKWSFNEDGSGSFDPNGRSMSSFEGKNSKQNQKKDSTANKQRQETATAKIDSSYQNNNDSINLKKKKLKEKDTVERKPDYSWILWVSGILVLLAGALLLYLKLKPKITIV